MASNDFLKAGHPPTLFAAFFYFDISFMVWVMLGPLGVQIAQDLNFDAAQKGLMVAVPLLAGAALRVVNGIFVDRIGPLRTGMIGQVIVILGLLTAWWFGVHSFAQVLLLGVLLGLAGASFAVALPLALRWYPPEYQGIALGIAGAGNSGTVFAALFAPGLAAAFGWTNVLGLAAIPLAVAFVTYVLVVREGARSDRRRSRSPSTPQSSASAMPGGSCSSMPSPSAASPASPPRCPSTSMPITDWTR